MESQFSQLEQLVLDIERENKFQWISGSTKKRIDVVLQSLNAIQEELPEEHSKTNIVKFTKTFQIFHQDGSIIP